MDVAAIKRLLAKRRVWSATAALACTLPVLAAVLPEDRADALYHSYDGGGVEINGPSVLVRKQLTKSSSISGNYYVDSITSASIDVVTTASPYTEERTEASASVDYLHEYSTMSLAYTNSEENDFSAKSAHFSFSQELFGNLTTLSMGYSRGWDVVRERGRADFEEDVDRQHYRLGVSQILTKTWLLDLGFEAITDEGFLNNPYRRYRYLTGDSNEPVGWEKEVYPRTRTSSAVAIRSMLYLPYRASVHGEYRFFTDTWGIDAHTAEIGYTHPYKTKWIFDFKYRYYTQTAADFYNDLFPSRRPQNYLARDKELSNFSNQTIGVGISYIFTPTRWRFVKKGSVNLSFDRLLFDYQDFRDARVTDVTPGDEPLYSFSANVVQLYLSIWY